ncbi:MarR family transcriptional regulator [Hyphomonas sp.]|uniref:MarR family winged helix-turn-helix transcriptional regulator n=1 Tax=Hyphomonas sp. TaxID=87 RepID=UPI001BCEB069|nr:MarR family transcriptional regulator [Hyphomonas sp.]
MPKRAAPPGPASAPLPPTPDLYFRLFTEIGILAQLSGNRFERALPHGLTVAQFSLLHHCMRLGDGWTPARLAAAFQVTRGTMTSTLQKLEAKGFIRIEPDTEDARSKRVFLTAAGRSAREASLGALMPDIAPLLGVLTPAEVTGVLPALEKLRAWLDANR